MKFCANCVHYSPSLFNTIFHSGAICEKATEEGNEDVTNLVTGEVKSRKEKITCKRARMCSFRCGQDAKWYKAKDDTV